MISNCFLSSLLFVFFVIQMSQIKGQKISNIWRNSEDCYDFDVKKETKETDGKHLENEKREFPFLVSLQTQKGIHFCSGTLINFKFILTTAHCIQSFKANDWKPSDMRAVMGTNNRRERTVDATASGSDKTVFFVDQWIINGCYDKKDSMSDDIALIRLKENIISTARIQPICLPPPDSEPLTGNVTVAGWGQWTPDFSAEDTKEDKDLKKAYLKLVHEQQCEHYTYFRTVGIYGTINYGNRLCAKSKQNSICVGDSGGPLLQVVNTTREGKSDRKNWYLIGIASTPSVGIGSNACHKSIPVLYLKISHYTNWIADETFKSYTLDSQTGEHPVYEGLYDITTECEL